MTKRKTAPAAERAGAPAFDIDGLLAMNMRIYQNMMRVHTELLDFTSRRLRADIEVAQKLTGGGNLDDAVEAVYGFQRKIISDYADEASELLMKTLSLWMPIGIHIAWNWTQGPLWGMNVSGMDIKDSFLISAPRGPELLSGGEFGAEGSLISAVVIAALCWYLWRAEWIKPSESIASIWRKYPSGFGVEPVDQEM